MQSKAWLKLSQQGQILCDSSNCRAPLWPLKFVRPDLCSLLRETARAKLEGISDDLFCHNKGIKKPKENVRLAVGGPAIVLVEITVPRHRAGPYCLKEKPPVSANGAVGRPRLSLQWRDE